jgi:hypothetical protein
MSFAAVPVVRLGSFKLGSRQPLVRSTIAGVTATIKAGLAKFNDLVACHG